MAVKYKVAEALFLKGYVTLPLLAELKNTGIKYTDELTAMLESFYPPLEDELKLFGKTDTPSGSKNKSSSHLASGKRISYRRDQIDEEDEDSDEDELGLSSAKRKFKMASQASKRLLVPMKKVKSITQRLHISAKRP